MEVNPIPEDKVLDKNKKLLDITNKRNESSSNNGTSETSSSEGNIMGWANNRDNLKKAAVSSADNYWDHTTGANSNLANSINLLSNIYKTDLSDAGSNYDRNLNTATNKYKSTVNPLTGEQGYQKRLGLAQRGAVDSADQAGATAMGTARSNNMSKGAAAALGIGQNINAYNQGLANQQNQVAQDFNNAINVAGNVYGQNATAAGNKYGTDVSGANNRYSTGANMQNQIASNTINAAGQDVANRTNIFNAVYNNQDAIEKLLTGATSGLRNLPIINQLFSGK